jgi:hypothetical protein
MLALLDNASPAYLVVAVVGVAALLIVCVTIVAVTLGIAVIRSVPPQDIPQGLTAVRAILEAAYRRRR